MSDLLSLTDEQQTVVAHDAGPALVFAVAGAGKTTAMVHRMARLVANGRLDPRRILATSFGRANVQDLKQALRPFPNTERIDVRTLHALGRDIIKQGQRFGVGRNLKLNVAEHGQISHNQRLLTTAIIEARKQNVVYKAELDGLDRQDFLDYVDQCKGNLRYANLSAANLPPEANHATQATDPSPQLTWYLDLYRLYEEIRVKQGIITFSDMLMTGWELLVRYPDLLTAVQTRYDHVMVDEFQDVNLAQSEILDLITQPHRNYMAIGDDDQTIYEWRGASPRYILDFPKRYDAKTYVMRDNFRCPAAPLVLANRVIRHNEKRYKKQLQLTQGFRGETAVYPSRDIFEMSQKIVQQLKSLHKKGQPLSEMAVLVRLNAQTPPIEQALILAKIPYRVSQPFYERLEIKTLIQYGRMAWLEREVQAGRRPLSSATARELFGEAWRDVSNRPKRYMSAEIRRRIWDEAIRQQRPLSHIIQTTASRVNYTWQAEPLQKLAEDLAWLAGQLDKKSHTVLRHLDSRLDYQGWLRSSSGFRQTGEGRAISVSTFIDYARKNGGNLTQFLQHIRQLAQQKTGLAAANDGDKVTVSTIHQAKGLEWETVIIPQCNQGFLPFLSDRPGDQAQEMEWLAEERRLFYVALTRTKRDCSIYVVQGERRSQFLGEGSYQAVLTDVPKVGEVVTAVPQKWSAEAVYLLIQTVETYGLHRFFERWWPLPQSEKDAILQTVLHFLKDVIKNDHAEQLNIKDEQLTFWRGLVGSVELPQKSFPGIKKLLKKTARQSKIDNGQSSIVNGQLPVPEPDTILPGMWVLTDAGWGQIEQILDRRKRPLPMMPRDKKGVRLSVILRPQQEALKIEVDVAAGKIRFGKGETLWQCTHCQQFITPQMSLIIDWHNGQVHDDVSPGFKKVKGTAVSLTTLHFAANHEPRMVLK